jgi:hypothetical protein
MLARDIKSVIACAESKAYSPELGRRIENLEDVYPYISGLLSVDENRILVFGKGGMSKIFRDTLFGGKKTRRRNIEKFVTALLQHDAELYEPLVKQVIGEISEQYGVRREKQAGSGDSNVFFEISNKSIEFLDANKELEGKLKTKLSIGTRLLAEGKGVKILELDNGGTGKRMTYAVRFEKERRINKNGENVIILKVLEIGKVFW